MARRQRKRRPLPPLPAPKWSERIYVQVAPSDIAMFRFLLEAHDHLALFTVVNKFKAVLMLRFSPHQRKEVEEFLVRVKDETGVQVLDYVQLDAAKTP